MRAGMPRRKKMIGFADRLWVQTLTAQIVVEGSLRPGRQLVEPRATHQLVQIVYMLAATLLEGKLAGLNELG